MLHDQVTYLPVYDFGKIILPSAVNKSNTGIIFCVRSSTLSDNYEGCLGRQKSGAEDIMRTESLSYSAIYSILKKHNQDNVKRFTIVFFYRNKSFNSTKNDPKTLLWY